MALLDFSQLADFFRQNEQFLIISHIRPDGDAYGSTLALGLSLQELGKEVQMVNEDGMLFAFSFLPGSNLLKEPAIEPPATTRKIISVDAAGKDRLGKRANSWERQIDVNIDHHISNVGFGLFNLIDPQVPATSQVLYEFLHHAQFPISPSVASNLFVGISTDTGSFRHRQTSARTFEIAGRLVEAGADPTTLALYCYSAYPAERLLLLREVLNEMHLIEGNRIAYFRLTPELCAKSGATLNDSKDLVEYLQTVQSVEVAFMIEVMDPQFRRVSLRSRGLVDVQKIASRYGGGGHRLAAGIRSTLEVAELEQKLITDIKAQLVSSKIGG